MRIPAHSASRQAAFMETNWSALLACPWRGVVNCANGRTTQQTTNRTILRRILPSWKGCEDAGDRVGIRVLYNCLVITVTSRCHTTSTPVKLARPAAEGCLLSTLPNIASRDKRKKMVSAVVGAKPALGALPHGRARAL